MTPDLPTGWATSYVDQAKQRAIVEKDSILKPKTRATFMLAAAVSTAEVVVKIAPAALLLVGHAFASAIGLVADISLCKKVSASFNAFAKDVRRASGSSLTSLGSVFHTDLTAKVDAFFKKEMKKETKIEWSKVREHQIPALIKEIGGLRQARLAAHFPEELYVLPPKEGASHSQVLFDIIADRCVAKIDRKIKELDATIQNPDLSAADKERLENEAVETLLAFVRKQGQKIVKAPMTYLEVVDYRLAKLNGLKGKALALVDEECSRVATSERAMRPEKFDEEQFQKRAAVYRATVEQRFNAGLTKVMQLASTMKEDQNAALSPIHNERKLLILNLQAVLHELNPPPNLPVAALTDERRAALTQQATELQGQLVNLKNVKQKKLAELASKNTFSRFQIQAITYENQFKSHVDIDGVITKEVERLVQPGLPGRVWRGMFKPVFNKGPGFLHNGLEGLLDPNIPPKVVPTPATA